MAKMSTTELLDAFKEMTLLELSDFVKQFEETFEVTALADVEPREVLLAKLAGAMKGNLTKAAGLFQAPLSQVARLAEALKEKKPAEGGSADAAAADTAAADTAAADTAAADTPTDTADAADAAASTD